MNDQEKALIAAWSSHPREWENNTWVYPVISRRAGGLSLGVNLNPDHHCSFSCAYCQSGPQEGHKRIPVDIDAVERELRDFLDYYESGEFAKCKSFENVPEQNKLLKDICLSGDGESTIVKEFPEGSLILGVPAKAVKQVSPEQIKMIQRNADNYVKLSKQYKPL